MGRILRAHCQGSQELPDGLQRARQIVRTVLPDEKFNEIPNNIEAFLRKDDIGEAVMSCLHVYFRESGDTPQDRLKVALLGLVMPETSDGALPYEARHKMFFEMGKMCFEKGFDVISIFFVSEVWTSENPEVAKPSEDPEKKECVMIAGLSADGRNNAKCIEINRISENEMRLGLTFVDKPFEEGNQDKTYSNLLWSYYEGYFGGFTNKLAEGN
jgi:hypothetical protein